MKKIITLLIISLLMLQTVAFADYSMGTDSNFIVVYGKTEPYGTASFVVLNCTSMNCANEEEALTKYCAALDGEEKLTSDDIFFFGTEEADFEGNWALTVNLDGIETINLAVITGENECEYITFASVEFRTGIIPSLKTAAAVEDDYASLTAATAKYIDYISDSNKTYKQLDNKKVISKYMKDIILSLSEDSSSLGIIKTEIDTAIRLAAISEGITNELEDVFYFGYNSDFVNSMTDEGVEKVIKLLQGEEYLNESSLIEKAGYQLALQHFNYNTNKNGDNLAGVLEDTNDILGLNLDKFAELKSSQKSKVAKELASKKCESKKALQDKLDDIVKGIIDSSKGSSGGGGGGSRGSGGSVSGSIPYSGSSTESISEKNIQEQKYIYSDLSLAPWSADAVVYLSGKGIVSGYTDGSFRPNAGITRAEFVKLVTEAFYGITNYEFETAFSDVPQDAWFAPYINKAFENGIVSGTGEGTFSPNDTITRQDMALILCNAAIKHELIAKAESVEPFADDADISEYAKDAINTLKFSGIVSGTGNGNFNPKATAGRAEACQMLYSLMIKSVK